MLTLRKSRRLRRLISFKPAQPRFEIVDTIAEPSHLVLNDKAKFDSDLKYRLGRAGDGVLGKLHLSQPDQPFTRLDQRTSFGFSMQYSPNRSSPGKVLLQLRSPHD